MTFLDAWSRAAFAASSDFCVSVATGSAGEPTGMAGRPPNMKIAIAAIAASATMPAIA